jgi:hypothetical protein
MAIIAWAGFTIGAALLALTGSSVIKTPLIPRDVSSGLLTAAVRRGT